MFSNDKSRRDLYIDTGATVSFAKLSYVLENKFKILPNNQLATLADDQTKLESLGEIHLNLERGECKAYFRALVLKNLHTNLTAGQTFMFDNKVVQDVWKKTITVQYKWTFPETSRFAPLQLQPNNHIHKFGRGDVIMPGQAYTAIVPYTDGTNISIEPHQANFCQDWPQHQICEVRSNSISILNTLGRPIILGKDVKYAQIRTTSIPAECTPTLNSLNCLNNVKLEENTNPVGNEEKSRPAGKDYTSEIRVNEKHFTKPQLDRLAKAHKKYANVFNEDLSSGYNHFCGKYVSKLNFADSTRPPARKTAIVNYDRDAKVLLQQVIDDLTVQGVLALPQQHDVQVQHVSPCFLGRRSRAKNKDRADLEPRDCRLLINFSELNTYLKTLPSVAPKQEDNWLALGKAKFIIQCDQFQGFFQNHNSPDDRKWVGICSPYGGLRILLRTGQGQMNSMEDLDELNATVLKDLLMEGILIKQADDLTIMAQTIDELIDNWIQLLAICSNCNLKISAPKTAIAPDSIDIHGWVWSVGGFLSPSPHKQLALAEAPEPQTVGEMKSWVGLYKTFLHCTPELAKIMDPFDQCTGGKGTKENVTWTPELKTKFKDAKQKITSMQKLYLPHPDDQLIILNDGAKKDRDGDPGIGIALFAQKDGKLLPVKHYSAKLQPHQKKWYSCEIEGVSCGTAIEVFLPWLRAAKHPTILGTDNLPVRDAARLMQRGQYSTSHRLQVFLNNINRAPIEIQHVSGKYGQADIPDYLSRTAKPCKSIDHEWHLCQLCRFIENNSAALLDDAPRLAFATVKELLEPGAPLPIGHRDGWRQLQLKDKACLVAIENLQTGKSPSKKTGDMYTQIRKYCAIATLSKDGLLVVKVTDPSPTATVRTQRIVIPVPFLSAILWQLHHQTIHPEKHQLIKVYEKYFFALGYRKVIDKLYEHCHLCFSMKKLPPQMLQFTTKTETKHPGIIFSADVIRRAKQKILAVRDNFSSFTGAMFINNEKNVDLRDALIRVITPLRYALPVVIRADNAPGFQVLQKGDPLLSRLQITIQSTNPMNKNSNAVIDKGIQELEREITKLVPSGKQIELVTLAEAVGICNQRLRRKGKFSAADLSLIHI